MKMIGLHWVPAAPKRRRDCGFIADGLHARRTHDQK
jgi:hypothetical protein